MVDFIQALSKSLKQEHTNESRRRSEICAKCPLKEQRFYSDFINAEIKEIQGFVCILCDCPIASKVFAAEPKNICTEWLTK